MSADDQQIPTGESEEPGVTHEFKPDDAMLRKELIKECSRIQEDADCSRRTMWNERDSLNRLDFGLRCLSGALKAFQLGVVSKEFMRATQVVESAPRFKGINTLAIVTVPITYILDSMIDFGNYPSRVKETNDIASEYDYLMSSTRLFEKVELSSMSVESARQKVSESQATKLDINKRRPPSLCLYSWKLASESIKKGESDYRVDANPSQTDTNAE